MITTRYLSAAAVALFMLGVAAGYSMGGAAPAPEAAHFRVKSAAQLLDKEQVQQAMVVAIDGMAPGVGHLAVIRD